MARPEWRGWWHGLPARPVALPDPAAGTAPQRAAAGAGGNRARIGGVEGGMMRPRSVLLLLVALAFALAGCQITIREARPSQFEGITWRAVSILGRTPVAGREPTMTYRAGQVEGNDGCNGYSGAAQLDGDLLAIGDLAGTLMGCEEPLGSLGGMFTEALRGGASLSVDPEGRLVLTTPRGDLVFVQEPVAA